MIIIIIIIIIPHIINNKINPKIIKIPYTPKFSLKLLSYKIISSQKKQKIINQNNFSQIPFLHSKISERPSPTMNSIINCLISQQLHSFLSPLLSNIIPCNTFPAIVFVASFLNQWNINLNLF